MILIWGLAADTPLAAVRACLERRKSEFVFLDQQADGHAEINLTVDDNVRGTLISNDFALNLDDVSAVYLRPCDLQKVSVGEKADLSNPYLQRVIAFQEAMVCWTEMTGALVVNRPSAMASNNSKPFQSSLIKLAGMDVPETLITTDPKAVLEFQKSHGTIIYKSISGTRSIVSKFSSLHLDRLCDVSACPTQFQEYIDGIDYRIHVVGDAVFGAEITCDAADYRYAEMQGASVEIRPFNVPDRLADQCRELTASLGLYLAGIDFRCTRSGRWCCFEVNPSPGFTYYQNVTGQKISDSIADLLGAGSETNRKLF